jgi:hypothetical protein
VDDARRAAGGVRRLHQPLDRPWVVGRALEREQAVVLSRGLLAQLGAE